jgi:transposase
VLIEDETDVLLFPPLRAAWARRGTQARVPLAGWNAKRVVFGAINARTGHRVLGFAARGRAADFQAFVRRLRRRYGRRPIALVLDEHPSHTATASRALARALAIELLFLPKRSPELNAMDHLWRTAKQKVCANRQAPGILRLVARFIRWVETLTNAQARRLAGLRSKRHWLRDAL